MGYIGLIFARNALLGALDGAFLAVLGRKSAQKTRPVGYEQHEQLELAAARFQVERDVLAEHVALGAEPLDLLATMVHTAKASAARFTISM